jgi:hypothetical protein
VKGEKAILVKHLAHRTEAALKTAAYIYKDPL